MTDFRTILWYITLLCVIRISMQECTVQEIMFTHFLQCEHITTFPDIPTWIKQHGAQFNIIGITNSNFTILKVGAFQSVDVEQITITETPLRIIEPSAFNNLSELTHLNLENNNISRITKGAFNNLTKLANLDLSNNSIQFMEDNSFLDTQIRYLYLQHNNIEDMSSIVDNCGSFESLYLHFNNIKNIHNLTNCSKLRILKISDNNIFQLQRKIFPGSLLELYLSNNKIESVEAETFAEMTKLDSLVLANNKLHKLSDGRIPLGLFQPLAGLKFLDVSHNGLSQLIPGTFTHLTSLSILNIAYNNLTDLPTGLLNHLPLNFLSINHNQLTNLEDKFFNHNYDITINMDDNRWSCNYLSRKIYQIISVNPNNRVNNGYHINTPNINGIQCTYAKLQGKNITMDTSSNKKLEDIKADEEETKTLLADIKDLLQNLTVFKAKHLQQFFNTKTAMEDKTASPDLTENVTYSRSQLRNFPNSYDLQIRALLLSLLLAVIALIVLISAFFAFIVYNSKRNS